MSRLGLGCTTLGSISARTGWRNSIRVVHRALERGITHFDTADAYGAGASEHVLGRALQGRLDGVTIATKGGYLFVERSPLERRARMAAADILRVAPRSLSRRGSAPTQVTPPAGSYEAQDFSVGYLTTALEGSLRRLGTDRIDIYQLHAPRSADFDEVIEWSRRMITAGKIGALGVGAEDLDQAAAWSASDAISSVQVPFGILDPEAGASVIPAAHSRGQSVAVRGVLGSGLLVGDIDRDVERAIEPKAATIGAVRSFASRQRVSPAQVAMWYVLARPDVDTVIVGASSERHVDELAAAVAAPLPDADVLGELSNLARDQGPQ